MASKHAATEIHSRTQTANETLQKYIQSFTDLAIHVTGADPTSVTYQVTSILFIRYLFNCEIKKQVASIKFFRLKYMPWT